MLFSPSVQLALRALRHLASQEEPGPVLVRDIAAAEGIPKPYLSKILYRLRMCGLVKSTKGPGGGYELAVPARAVRVSQVLEAFDERGDLGSPCVLGGGRCDEQHHCPLHERWKRLQTQFFTGIASVSIDEIARQSGGRKAHSRRRRLPS
jgi:Rrf2 family iron-sulfur cluster assembly transcriptional regulator